MNNLRCSLYLLSVINRFTLSVPFFYLSTICFSAAGVIIIRTVEEMEKAIIHVWALVKCAFTADLSLF